jgi:hypothetical protein
MRMMSIKFECAQYCGEASAGDRFSSVVRTRNGHNVKGCGLEAAQENFEIGFATEKRQDSFKWFRK